MEHKRRTLFDPIVATAQLHPGFEVVRTFEGSKCARGMLDEIYAEFEDPDGNFLEQFQTTGFDARFFELYVFAYLSRSGFVIDRGFQKPDFLASKDGLGVAIEATTVNPPRAGILKDTGREIGDLSGEELREYMQNELVIRFGSPLYSKLKKRYWELPHCRGMPLAIVIEPFHDEQSLLLSDNSLLRYVYGLGTTVSWATTGMLDVETEIIDEHVFGEKRIPSNFFAQPDAEHISAVLFTNCGTTAKFSRMGYQHGIGCDEVEIRRIGAFFTPDRDARDPSWFSYSLARPPIVETWGQGLVVMHNPNCLHPIPIDFFPDAVQAYVEHGSVMTDHSTWHPFSSKTMTFHVGEQSEEFKWFMSLRDAGYTIGPIPREEFCHLAKWNEWKEFSEEQGWYSDGTMAFLGIVLRNPNTDIWAAATFARDRYFRFRIKDTNTGFVSREDAVVNLLAKMTELVSKPQRLFSDLL